METPSSTQLHQLAKKRVEFRSHLVVFFVIMAALWGIWYFTGHGYPWPIWPMAIWGIGVVFHYMFEYRPLGMFSEEEEYKKLKKKFEGEHEVIR